MAGLLPLDGTGRPSKSSSRRQFVENWESPQNCNATSFVRFCCYKKMWFLAKLLTTKQIENRFHKKLGDWIEWGSLASTIDKKQPHKKSQKAIIVTEHGRGFDLVRGIRGVQEIWWLFYDTQMTGRVAVLPDDKCTKTRQVWWSFGHWAWKDGWWAEQSRQFCKVFFFWGILRHLWSQWEGGGRIYGI